MPQDELSLSVVGLDFPHANKSESNRRFEMALCAPGEQIHLVPERRNPADRNAVAVFSARAIQLGYLTAKRAPWTSRRIGEGEEYAAIFQAGTSYAAIVRVRFGGGAPTLPPLATTPAAQDDFEPDPEGSE